jgi:hypothetical protein
MKGSEEGCVLREELAEVKKATGLLETRVAGVEEDMKHLRNEVQASFRQGESTMNMINTALGSLAHDFGERMNNFDKRFVEEKEKWGNCLRTILLWGAKVLIGGAAVAMGINLYKSAMAYFGGGAS